MENTRPETWNQQPLPIRQDSKRIIAGLVY